MAAGEWQLESPFKELDEHLENAYKRVAGLADFKLGQDRLNRDALSSSARQIMDITCNSGEPFFMRIGRSVGTAASYRPRHGISLKELAAEVLGEFHNEAVGAFSDVKLRLYNESSAWLKAQGLDDERRQAALTAAAESFLPPPREEMTRAALPYVNEGWAPSTWAGLGTFAGALAMLFTLRHPLFLAIGAGGGAGLCYYLARGRMATKAQTLMVALPQDTYNLIRRALVSNQTRYQEIVNNAAKS